LHAGADAVHQAVNYMAAFGGAVDAVTIQVLWPPQAEEAVLKAIMDSAAKACSSLQIAIGRCDAMLTEGLVEPMVIATAIGHSDALFCPELPKAEQDIIMTGYAGWKDSVQLAEKKRSELAQHFNPAYLDKMLSAVDRENGTFSCVPAVKAACKAGVTAMCAVGEGGVFAAAWELCERAGLGAKVHLKDIPLRQETVEICDYFGVSPYQIAAEGSLLLAVDHGQKVLTELAAAGIPAVIIGHLTDDNDRVVLNEEEVRYLEPFR
jgi:hydrogenase maturation factor